MQVGCGAGAPKVPEFQVARCRFPKETANYGGGKELRHLGVDFPRAAPRFLQNGLRGVAFSSNELRHLGPRPRWFHGPTTVKPLGLWGDPGGFHGPPTVKPLGLWGDPGGFTVGDRRPRRFHGRGTVVAPSPASPNLGSKCARRVPRTTR